MAFLDELFAPQTASPTGEVDVKQFLAPIMQAMATEAQRASDPISRIGDVGSAVLSTVGHGTPYAQNLAALDKGRKDTIQGGAQMFLQMLGMERQVDELKAQERRHQDSMSVQRAKMAQDDRQFKTSAGLSERRLDDAAAERRTKEIQDEQKRQESDHDTTRKTLSSATNDPIRFAGILDNNPEYVAARKARDWEKANKIAASAAEAVGKKNDLPADLRTRDVAYTNVGDAAKELTQLLKTGPSVIDPTDRARIRQLWSKMVLQYGIATGRGANYTELEMSLVKDILGQSPTDLRYRSIESIARFQDRLNTFQEGMGREQGNLRGSGVRNSAPVTSPNWRAEPDAPKVETRGPGYEIQAPPGWKATGRFTKDGRPIFTDGANEIAPPRQ